MHSIVVSDNQCITKRDAHLSLFKLASDVQFVNMHTSFSIR